MTKDLVVVNNADSEIANEIKLLRIKLETLQKKDEPQIILVTSASAGDGKSFLSSNLAVAFTSNHKRVLLIDCDLRNGKQNKIFGLSNKNGLTSLILKHEKIEDINEYIKPTNISRLNVTTTGPKTDQASEIIASTKFKKLLLKLKKEFDVIILDSPSIDEIVDPLVLAKIADQTVIVTRIGYTQIDKLLKAKEELIKVEANIAGIVVNSCSNVK